MSNGINAVPEKWVNLEDIAVHLNVSKDTIRVYVKKKNIPFHRVGKQYKFRVSEVDAWVESGEAAKIDVSRE
jgi:excisionase family DNA binding protein